MSFLVIFFGLGFGKWRFGRAGKMEDGVHGGHEAHEQCEFEQNAAPRIANLLLPAAVLISMIFFLFWWTGRGGGRSFFQAILHAQFGQAIFYATFGTVIVTAIFYALQRIPLAEMESHFLSGNRYGGTFALD